MPKIFSTCLVVLTLSVLASRAEQMTNGNFETFSAGVPTSWNYQRGAGDAANLESSVVSPFTGVYPASTRSVLLTDGAGTGSTPQLKNFFAATPGAFAMSFDFRLGGSALAGDPWVVAPLGISGLVAFDLFLDNEGTFRVTDGFTQNIITPLALSTWYHVQINGSTVGGVYSGSITPFGGAPIAWGNKAFINSLADIRTMSVFDNSNGAISNDPLYLDNMSFAAAVPEPALWQLLALALPILRFARRRK